MKVIYKQELRVGCGEQVIRFVSLWTVLKMELQRDILCGDALCIWFLCDPEGPVTEVVFTTLGTGDTSSDSWFEDNHYVGTYQTTEPSDGSPFVGHVFMREE